ncbi:hypothetical protein H5410_060245 [Solanum commersonii]|uniref:Uncharacterized protein n=1 Tax=Solanum commersonii TaxID=4109 RepID=A0A9J5W524_SOLCO|nr:hypothetical protein H5410_060245 [Solanum commersonii]
MDTTWQEGTRRLKSTKKWRPEVTSIGLKIAFCSNVLIPKGKGQVGSEMKQSEGDEIDQTIDRRVYRRSRLTSLKERGRKTKTTKLIAGGIGSTWVHLDRVNPSPSPTHSAREREWA